MIAGLSGSLLSHDALAGWIASAPGARLDAPGASAARSRLRPAYADAVSAMGPASSARAVFDAVAAPLAAALGFRVVLAGMSGGNLRALLESRGVPAAAMVVTPWDRDPGSAWREGVHHGIGSGLRWSLCFNGPSVRLLDARRTYTRRFAQFDLAAVLDDAAAFGVLWGLLRAEASVPADGVPALDRAVLLSEQYRADVRASLQDGVHQALSHLLRAFSARHPRNHPRTRAALPAPDACFEESLIVVYRVLFLLFAEARGLVPHWHPTYRDSYTIESLRPAIEQLPRPRGLWESLQAIARLAHRGCRAGPLHVPPFNGRLFSPAHAPLAESTPLDDGAVRQALLSLTTRPMRDGRERISYADLGVEHLGGVYERVLELEPAARGGRAPALVPSGRRKATGSFYTPRSLTEYVVRRTLAPLAEAGKPEAILSLRVLDPAMGSGAFLVAACRYLADAYEAALIRIGAIGAGDVSPDERAGFRRAIAQRCLYGVDLNPMAVQLGRLSLWLATLARDKPLTFLDHHLRAGNSLVGASLDDLARRPPPGANRRGRVAALPLFERDAAGGAISAVVGPRMSLAADPDDTLEQVRTKERVLAGLSADDSPVGRWKRVADLWCAGWFRDPGGRAASRAAFGSLSDRLLHGAGALPPHVGDPLLAEAREISERERFFHWTLEFPEAFYAADGVPLERPGFDAVIGNPPWEMLRGDAGDAGARRSAASMSARLTAFTRESGVYPLQGDGQANLYQMFVERSLALVKPGGRIGLIVPSGLATDHGSATLRRHVLDRTAVDTFVSVENRDGLFPIHRGLRFLLLAATAGARTESIPSRSGVRAPAVLDDLPDTGVDPSAVPLPRALLERISGEQLAVPEIRCAEDLSIASRLAFTFPPLGGAEGWHVRFGRELNASDDRAHFVEGPASAAHLPVVEGKQLRPFAVEVAASRFRIPESQAARLLHSAATYERPRLAYRDVASATNRLTLIAAIVPAGAVTTHTLFCLKGEVPAGVQSFLCGVFNSFVANYLIRMRVSTHVTVAIVSRLPVPRPALDSGPFRAVAALGEALTRDPADADAAARLQGAAGRLYGLTSAEFRHVLSTFPIVEDEVKARAMRAFEAMAVAI